MSPVIGVTNFFLYSGWHHWRISTLICSHWNVMWEWTIGWRYSQRLRLLSWFSLLVSLSPLWLIDVAIGKLAHIGYLHFRDWSNSFSYCWQLFMSWLWKQSYRPLIVNSKQTEGIWWYTKNQGSWLSSNFIKTTNLVSAFSIPLSKLCYWQALSDYLDQEKCDERKFEQKYFLNF